MLKGYYSYRLKNGRKKSTVTKEYTVINQALDYTIRKKIISVNSNSAITLHIPSDKLKTDFSNRTYLLIPYVVEKIKAKKTLQFCRVFEAL